MPRGPFRFLALIALVALSCHSGSDAMAEPVVIDNPASAPGPPVLLQAERQWALGGDSEDDAEFFGFVRDLVVDADGNLYALDRQLCEVRAYSVDGEYLRSFGREGEGPGEFRRPMGLALLPGAGIGVVHGMPARVTAFGLDGSIGPDLHIGDESDHRFIMVPNLRSAGEWLVAERRAAQLGEGQMTMTASLLALGPDGEIRTTILEQSQERPQRGPGMRISMGADFVSTWALGSDGRVFVAPSTDRYLVDVYGADGRLQHSIRRAYERVPRSKEQLDRMKREVEELRERMGGFGDEISPDPFRPDIASLHPRPDGSLWVLSSQGLRGEDSEVVGVFDVFDREGRLQRQVELRADYDADDDVFVLAADRLFVIEESNEAARNYAAGLGGGMMILLAGGGEDDDEEAEPLSIVSYRLEADSK